MSKTDTIEDAITRVLLKKGFLRLCDTMAKEEFKEWCECASNPLYDSIYRGTININDLIDDLPSNKLDYAMTLMNLRLKKEKIKCHR